MNLRRTSARAVALGVAIIVAASGLLALAETATVAPASATTSDSFQAGNIISDQNFFDANAMSVTQIQTFLNSEISGCTTGNCLNVLQVDTTTRAASYTPQGNLICNPYVGAPAESAATVIYKVQQACSVSAKAILVTLQKEEGLVTATSVSAATLARAMGYGCPDSAAGACDTAYYGFYNQVYLGARELRRYGTPTVAGNYQPGVNYIAYSPIVVCGGSSVSVVNRATAALYNYTPYQPDQAALTNMFSTGDTCSSYGNRNFWSYYNSWFGDPTVPAGTPEANLTVTPIPNAITVSGWAVDPDAVTGAVPVSLRIDNGWFALSASSAGADLSSQYPGAGTNHYFSGTYPLTPGNHSLCTYLVNVGGAGSQGTLGCQTVAVPSAPAPVAAFTSVTASYGSISVSGWALRPDAPTAPVNLAVNLGSTWIGMTTNQPNATASTVVAAAGPNQGFTTTFAAPPGAQSFCLWATPTAGPSVVVACTTVTVPTPAPAVAAIDAVTGVPGAVNVSGWAVYPGAPTTSVNMAIQVGASWYGLTANSPNSEAKPGVSGAGPNQGFVGSVPLPAGTYSVCIWVSEPTGGAVNLGCQSATVPAPAVTKSQIDSIAGGAGSVSVAGWSIWPDQLAASVNMAVQINTSWYSMTANGVSAEGAAAVPGAGANHGFADTIPLAPGTYPVCVWAGASAGGAASIGCHTVVVTAAAPTASHLDSIVGGVGSFSVSGWAVWPNNTAVPVNMAIQVGSAWTGMTANLASTEAPIAVAGAGTSHGFAASVTMAPGTYVVCVWASASAGGATNIGCNTVTVLAVPAVKAQIDSITGGTGSVAVAGWAVWPDKLSTSVHLAIQVNASWYDMTANTTSAEAASAVPGAGTAHGFSQSETLAPGTYPVCVWASLSQGGAVDVGCKTVTVN